MKKRTSMIIFAYKMYYRKYFIMLNTNIKLVLLFFIILTVSLLACRKETEPIEEKEHTIITSTDEINVPPDFDWKTTEDIDIIIEGLFGSQSNYKNTLLIKSLSGKVFLKHLMYLNQGYTGKIKLPTNVDKVRMIYGKTNELINIENNMIFYTYVKDTTVIN